MRFRYLGVIFLILIVVDSCRQGQTAKSGDIDHLIPVESDHLLSGVI
jgi:hypothetical protein